MKQQKLRQKINVHIQCKFPLSKSGPHLPLLTCFSQKDLQKHSGLISGPKVYRLPMQMLKARKEFAEAVPYYSFYAPGLCSKALPASGSPVQGLPQIYPKPPPPRTGHAPRIPADLINYKGLFYLHFQKIPPNVKRNEKD